MTAGADVPQLWVLFETFFGKIDDNISVASTPLTTGHSITFRAAKRCQSEGGTKVSSYTQIIPGSVEDEPGMDTILNLFHIVSHLTTILVLFKIRICL